MNVYFVQSRDGALVKIGRASVVERRVRAIVSTHPGAVLLGVRTDITERDAHRYFRSLRVAGEWFSATPELLLFVHSSEPIPTPRRAMRAARRPAKRAVGIRFAPSALEQIQQIAATTGERVTVVIRRLLTEEIERAA